jgi:hypothetical protein
VRRGARVLLPAAVLAAAVLAGCGTPAPPAPTPSAPTPSAAPPSPSAPAVSPDEAVCAEYRTDDSVLRRTVQAMQQMPVLPAGVNLVLLNVRMVAQSPGVQDPELMAAQAELVAAIDDLDVQGRALIGPEGNAVTDAVQFDTARILAALTEVERVCGET